MSSLEHGFRPSEVYAPFDKMGGLPSRPTREESPQSNPFETPPAPSQITPEIPPDNPTESAVALIAQSIAARRKQQLQQITEVAGTTKISSKEQSIAVLPDWTYEREQKDDLWAVTGRPQKNVGFSPEEVVSLHVDQHISVRDLAKRFTTSESTLYKMLDAGGFDKEARHKRLEQQGYQLPTDRGIPKKVTVSAEELMALHRDQHIPVSELAKRFNVTPKTIYEKLQRYQMREQARELGLPDRVSRYEIAKERERQLK